MKKTLTVLSFGFAVIALSGCSHANNGYYATPSMNSMGHPMEMNTQHSGYNMQQQQPMQQMPMAGYADTSSSEKVSNEVNVLRERLRRLERAMVRLDRRMQLIERNELSRMSGSVMEGASTPSPQGSFQPMSYGSPKTMAPQLPSLAPVPTPSAQGQTARFQPVGYGQVNNQQITSSLGVAPKKVSQTSTRMAADGYGRLPSLADDAEQQKEHNVAIWTISYENGKVWPNRNQLPSSRDVIESLNSGEPVALFARGAKPSSREFRERVRAISKYLSKVTEIDNLPIASMSAKHLDGDTIELLATQ